jgi:hypothetical protein
MLHRTVHITSRLTHPVPSPYLKPMWMGGQSLTVDKPHLLVDTVHWKVFRMKRIPHYWGRNHARLTTSIEKARPGGSTYGRHCESSLALARSLSCI